MGRKKTDRKIGNHTEIQMKNALDAIKAGKSIRQAAQEFNIAFTTLQRYNKSGSTERLTPNYKVRKIFTTDQEKALHDYFEKCALMFYGLTSRDCRKIAYEMAKMNNVNVPQSWEKNQIAGIDWLRGFRERFPDMSLRKPENCSLARATSFNRETVKKFFDNLENVLGRSPAFADGTRIYNLDETATSTVQKNPRVLAPKGKRNICKVASGEKGTLITTCNIISAGGYALPPALVFPRKKINPRMQVGTPPGSLILASSTGWMNSETFVEVMKHFILRSGSSKDFPTVLIMDNHESHLSIEALDLAKQSGVTILTLHPHTSAKLQPLDVGIHGPFKTYYASAMESWMMRNPGSPVTIYDIGALVGQAFEKSMTPVNIKNSFKKTGIYPFDRNIFSDDDFMPSIVTDRPTVQEPAAAVLETDEVSSLPIDLDNISVGYLDDDTPSPSVLEVLQNMSVEAPCSPTEAVTSESAGLYYDITQIPATSTTPPSLSHMCMTAISASNNAVSEATPLVKYPCHANSPLGKSNIISSRLITPEEFRKPLKAAARNNKRKPRRLGRSLIATDTPEKEEIMNAKKAIKRKKDSKSKGIKAIRKILHSDSDEDCDVVLDDDSLDEWSWYGNEENEEHFITEESLMQPLPRLPKEGEYVLVEFSTKNQIVYYVAKILEERNDNLDLYVSYLRHKKGRFTMPNTPDLAYVKDDNIKLLLPTPTSNGSTARQQSYLTFSVDLSGLNIR